MEEANRGHEPAYGGDSWTARAADAFRALFETELRGLLRLQRNSRQLTRAGVALPVAITASSARKRRTSRPTSAARRSFSPTARSSSLPVRPTASSRPRPSVRLRLKRTDIHYPKPRVVTITQSTETGQLYQIDEIRAISDTCRELGLSLHMDGARFANACALARLRPAEMTWKSRRGRAVLRRHQERHGDRRGRDLLRHEARRGLRLSLQAGRAAGLQDALPCRPLGPACWKAARGFVMPSTPIICAMEFARKVRDLPGSR